MGSNKKDPQKPKKIKRFKKMAGKTGHRNNMTEKSTTQKRWKIKRKKDETMKTKVKSVEKKSNRSKKELRLLKWMVKSSFWLPKKYTGKNNSTKQVQIFELFFGPFKDTWAFFFNFETCIENFVPVVLFEVPSRKHFNHVVWQFRPSFGIFPNHQAVARCLDYGQSDQKRSIKIKKMSAAWVLPWTAKVPWLTFGYLGQSRLAIGPLWLSNGSPWFMSFIYVIHRMR